MRVALDPAALTDADTARTNNPAGTVSKSTPTALCAYPGCDQHALPDSSWCADERHTAANAIAASDGTVTGVSDISGSLQSDGTGRSRRRKPRHNAQIRQERERELRVVAEKKGIVTVQGYALVYEKPYEVHDAFGTFIEVMKRGAAANVTGDDCRFLVNHQGIPLARTTTKTLTLTDDSVGLRILADLDVANNTLAADVASCIDRGDMSQMSIGFIVAKDGDNWNDAYTYRRITRIGEMLDVSPVTYPASPTTSISIARSGPTPGDVRARYVRQRQQAKRDQLIRRLSPAARRELEGSAR